MRQPKYVATPSNPQAVVFWTAAGFAGAKVPVTEPRPKYGAIKTGQEDVSIITQVFVVDVEALTEQQARALAATYCYGDITIEQGLEILREEGCPMVAQGVTVEEVADDQGSYKAQV